MFPIVEVDNPFPKNIERIKEECHRLDDDMRWLVALLCDSGLRLGEATGLAKDDLVLDHSIPHVKVKPHPWRSLKTVGSEREVPLIGISLWAAKELKKMGVRLSLLFKDILMITFQMLILHQQL